MSEIAGGASDRRTAVAAEAAVPPRDGGGSPLELPAGALPALDEAGLAEAERRTAEACALLRQARRPQIAGDPIYARPWFLAIGEGRPFLEAAGRHAPFPRPVVLENLAAPLLSWWLTETLVAAAPAAALGRGMPPDAPDWRALERLMAIIVRHRPLRPLDGLLAFVPCDMASRDPAAAAAVGRQARAVADEWQRSVGFRLPVSLVLTGLEALAGHQALISALSRELAERAIGVRLEAVLDPAARRARLEAGLAALETTMARLRLGLLLAGGEGIDRRGAFRLPVDFAAVGRGVRAAAEALLAPDTALRPAFLRSVWFAATAGSGAHVDDLIHRLLPADAALCVRT